MAVTSSQPKTISCAALLAAESTLVRRHGRRGQRHRHPGWSSTDELEAVIAFVADEARKYLDGVERSPGARSSSRRGRGDLRRGSLPEEGVGAVGALEELVAGGGGLVHSAGPKFFHFVNGGVTPAASARTGSRRRWTRKRRVDRPPLTTQLEAVALGWLQELFGLPAGVGRGPHHRRDHGELHRARCGPAVVGPAAGRGRRRATASRGLPRSRCFGERLRASERHEGARRCSGIGRGSVRKLARTRRAGSTSRRSSASSGPRRRARDRDRERRRGERRRLRPDRRDGRPRASATARGCTSTGRSVCSPRSRRERAHLVEGVERADSVIADGHKWLNVPYDCGFAFVNDAALQAPIFTLGRGVSPRHRSGRSRLGIPRAGDVARARAFAGVGDAARVRAQGYRAIVEKHLDLAQHLARRVDEAPDLERLADVALNIVCFRYHPRASRTAPRWTS